MKNKTKSIHEIFTLLFFYLSGKFSVPQFFTLPSQAWLVNNLYVILVYLQIIYKYQSISVCIFTYHTVIIPYVLCKFHVYLLIWKHYSLMFSVSFYQSNIAGKCGPNLISAWNKVNKWFSITKSRQIIIESILLEIQNCTCLINPLRKYILVVLRFFFGCFHPTCSISGEESLIQS